MPRKMSHEDIYAFLQEAPRTGHLATVREDGRPHVATIWIAVDGEDIVFTTFETSVKGKNLRRTGYAALSVDDPHVPFSYIALEGPVTIDDDPDLLLHWATLLASRFMGADRAREFGARNGVEGELLCRLTPTHLSGMTDMTG
ncbi:MAG: PPOX class F420-dependent oxidoreductase [Thermomicrobiales bacterium]